MSDVQPDCGDANSALLRAHRLTCVRGERRLFTDLALSLAAGQALQIEGPNGSGKTSLLRILCGLSLPEEGRIDWCGQDVNEYRAEFLVELAYVGHANGIKEELTPRENLVFARGLGRARHEPTVTDALTRLGLTGFEDRPCRKLSAGQRRRVALARLLVSAARLWMLDEPLTALDARACAQVEEMLRAHLDQGGLVILTTHRPIALGDGRVQRITL